MFENFFTRAASATTGSFVAYIGTIGLLTSLAQGDVLTPIAHGIQAFAGATVAIIGTTNPERINDVFRAIRNLPRNIREALDEEIKARRTPVFEVDIDLLAQEAEEEASRAAQEGRLPTATIVPSGTYIPSDVRIIQGVEVSQNAIPSTPETSTPTTRPHLRRREAASSQASPTSADFSR